MTGPVVVTGAAGFVGRALLRHLKGAGIAAVGVSRSAASDTKRVADYADAPAPDGAILVHLAQARDASAPVDPLQLATCRALAAKPWRHVVYASSAVVYGDRLPYPRRPDEAVQPEGAYGKLKAACEAVFADVSGTIVRLANLYGPGMAANNVLADVLRQIPGDGALRLRDLTPVRDFLWIDDAVRCLAGACRAAPGGVLNAGSGRGVAVGDLARLALELAGESHRPVAGARNGTRASTLVLDIAGTRAALGWTPEIDLCAGLTTLLESATHEN